MSALKAIIIGSNHAGFELEKASTQIRFNQIELEA
jgi:hypothetical protein